ncbi:enoyl-ACP reductase FabI [Deefgea sp. CFH1-16]|uniref:enoyl-ACP reductase FabI n=1 Tax=Deefgea sp. CFH1-16 TaxID=2675457 RepID=UPI00194020FE|nr:enoyl-ACP reductase FabI [Deefgea sp. CFH1-16]
MFVGSLAGKVALVMGIANEDSIAYGVAKALKARGAELILTYQTEKTLKYIQPIIDELQPGIVQLCDVQDEAAMVAVFAAIAQKYAHLDIAVHSIAFAQKEDLHGRVVDSSAAGFALAMDVSCHSFIRMAHRAEALMDRGGTLLAMSYYGAEKVVPNYGMMGPVKAALESSVRYMASELGPKKIRVHAVSPGPVKTRAASGIREFDLLISNGAGSAPLRELPGIDDVGEACAFLCEDGAARMTGSTLYIDGGMNILA